MAAESGGETTTMVLDVRSPESVATAEQELKSAPEQPIDLSRNKDSESAKITRVVPPLIPINRTILKKRWIIQNQNNPDNNPVNVISSPVVSTPPKNIVCKKRRAAEMNSVNEEDIGVKSTRDEDSRTWDLRLDRAHSVPHLRSLPPLLRCKSLSESRIAPNSYTPESLQGERLNTSEHNNNNSRPVAFLLEHEQELQRQRLQQMQIDLANLQQTSSNDETSQLLKNMPNYDSLLRVGYYTQMLQCFQAQEMLRQFALQRQPTDTEQLQEPQSATATEVQPSAEDENREVANAAYDEHDDNLHTQDIALEEGSYDESELRRRATRPLTGRHVRSGTGASPATLLTLRKKIQARQQQRGNSK